MVNVLDLIISNTEDQKRKKTPEWEPEPLHISPPTPERKKKKENKEDNDKNVIIIDI